MANSQSVASIHQLHPVGEVCPTCDQPIPNDRVEEITRRLAEREQQKVAALTAEIQEKFDLELTKVAEAARLKAEQDVANAKLEAMAEAEAAARERIEAATAASAAAAEALATKTAEAATATEAAIAAQSELMDQLAHAEEDKQAALDEVRAEAAETLQSTTQKAVSEALATAATQIEEAKAGKEAAEQSAASLQAKFDETVRASQEAVERAAAETATARGEVETLKANQDAALRAAISEQREALDADKVAAINAERSAAFEEKQGLIEKVAALQRALEKKTANELGEGAEIDLFETLKAEFEDDRIERVKKGQPGADIIHTVIHNGQLCGKIVYDSKNHGAWRNDFVTKLRADQMAENAEHAILTAMKFPQGARHLHNQDGVLVANPARVVALVQILRRHMIQSQTLRMSAQQRAEKTNALYDFITSEQCRGMFERLDTHAQKLLDIQAAERTAHEKVWNQQGLTIKASQKVHAELQYKIDSIIGTASANETDR